MSIIIMVRAPKQGKQIDKVMDSVIFGPKIQRLYRLMDTAKKERLQVLVGNNSCFCVSLLSDRVSFLLSIV